jgi:hypothetical protein
MKVKKLGLLALTGFATTAIISCGGGGGSVSASVEPSKDYQGTYKGAASQGDFAIFRVNGTQLSYIVNGTVFNKDGEPLTDNLTLKPLAVDAGPETHFWKGEKNGTVKAYIFLANNMGMAYVPNVQTSSGETVNATVVGLRNVTNATTIIGKTFVYADIDSKNEEVDGCEITINENGTISYECLNSCSGTGCWKQDPNDSSRLLATDEVTDCANWDGSNPKYYIVAKPGTSRAGFVLDKTDGSGIGIGLEKKSYTDIFNDNNKNKKLIFEGLDGDVKATTVVYYNSTSGQWEYEGHSQDKYGTYTWHGILYPDRYCDAAGNTYSYPGVICAHLTYRNYPKEDEPDWCNVFFDTTDGYYIAVGADNPQYLEIGAFVGEENNTQSNTQ